MSSPCARPECGGEVHTDGWGTPIRCPARRCPRCDCADGAEQCEHCKVCPHADGGPKAPPEVSKLDQLKAAIERARQLHRPVEFRDRGTICAECSAFDGSSTDNSPVGYAHCATLKALDEEQP